MIYNHKIQNMNSAFFKWNLLVEVFIIWLYFKYIQYTHVIVFHSSYYVPYIYLHKSLQYIVKPLTPPKINYFSQTEYSNALAVRKENTDLVVHISQSFVNQSWASDQWLKIAFNFHWISFICQYFYKFLFIFFLFWKVTHGCWQALSRLKMTKRCGTFLCHEGLMCSL